MPLRRVVAAALDSVLDVESDRWAVHGRLDGRSGTAIMAIGPDPHSGGLLKASDRPWGRRGLEHQNEVLAALHADARLGAWRDLLPRVLAAGEVDGVYWVLEARLPGGDGRRHLADPDRRDPFVTASLAAISELNRRTASLARVSDPELDRWVRQPLALVRTILHGQDRRAVDQLERELAARLAGRRVAVGWTHGDYHPANILTNPDGTIAGIVDWCAAERDGMAVLDTAGFLLSVDMSVLRQDLGAVVRRWLSAGRTPDVQAVPHAEATSGADRIDARTVIILAWLRHVALFVATEPPGVVSPVWISRNVRPVVRAWTASNEGEPLR